ncbi:MAG: transcription-repair coupling factor [Bacteroidales bacterium]|nr:transcription-repair coupling factor [Bacteroidales bacterium]
MNTISLREIYLKNDLISGVAKSIGQNQHSLIDGTRGSATAVVTSALTELLGGQHLIVCRDKESAAYFYNDLENLYNEREHDFNKKRVLYYPCSYKRPYEPEKPDNTYILSRTEVLSRVTVSTRKTIVVSYPEALCEKVVTKRHLSKFSIKLKVNEKVSLDFVADLLVEYNFERVDFVIEPGQFSIRGGILDVFSFANDHPYRIEFFGDEVETIRSFNPVTQLSLAQMNSIQLLPNVQDRFVFEERESLINFISDDLTIWLDESFSFIERVNVELTKAIVAFEKNVEDKTHQNPFESFSKGEELWDQINQRKTIEFGSKSALGAAFTASFRSSAQPHFNKNFELLISDLQKKNNDRLKVYILSESTKQIDRLTQILHDLQSDKTDIVEFQYINHSLESGFVDYDLQLCCYTDHQIFERYHKFHIRESFAAKETLTIKQLNDLNVGDFVSHIDHGIGRFDGMEIIDNNGKQQEAIRLVYQNDDILYVSIHSLHRISKYSGKEGAEPSLNKLGSNAWNKLKNKAKSRVKDIARDLIKLYAERKHSVGFQYMPDTYLQTELEASFIYEDTPDQIKATSDVKADMESEAPMDRLICGDVGFGKTEIAIRAAFKAVNDSKQVAILVPTTILALQHYKTFAERLADFPATVDYLNRFRSANQQKETLAKLKEGKIDILIGTHRLISKDVEFKDLGLLIIDEEQKFGVSAKEKLKQIKANVDTLTLTATPIPRTLQFSMMGARDLSIINTPPPNRYPVQTELRTFNREVISEAVLFEINRGGQVFFVHNRVQNILDIQTMLMKFVPGIRIGVAHGQMEGHHLEKVMLDFIEGYYDVLLATTIIESGLDISNANTIIINDAQNFGLSDLHQLRGRVGRSNKKAFCYLLTPPLAALPSEAQKRLRAINEFSELGSGFNISMRDLDIRGAGNLLGGEQSGFISEIGYEMFHKILDEAINELKETEFGDLFPEQHTGKFVKDCVIESDLEILFPSEYIDSSTERISLYTELDNVTDEDALKAFTERLIDRFGPIPKQAGDLLNTIRLRWLARELGFEKIVLRNKTMIAYFIADQASTYFQTNQFMQLLKFAQANQHKCKLKETADKLLMYVKDVTNINSALDNLRKMKEFE